MRGVKIFPCQGNHYPEIKTAMFWIIQNSYEKQWFQEASALRLTCSRFFQTLVALLCFLGFSFNAISSWQLWTTAVHKFSPKFQFLVCPSYIFCLRELLFLHITTCASYWYNLLQLGYPHRPCNHWRLELCWYYVASPSYRRYWV